MVPPPCGKRCEWEPGLQARSFASVPAFSQLAMIQSAMLFTVPFGVSVLFASRDDVDATERGAREHAARQQDVECRRWRQQHRESAPHARGFLTMS